MAFTLSTAVGPIAVSGSVSSIAAAVFLSLNDFHLASTFDLLRLFLLILFCLHPLVCVATFFDPRAPAEQTLRSIALQRFIVFANPIGLPFLPMYLLFLLVSRKARQKQ